MSYTNYLTSALKGGSGLSGRFTGDIQGAGFNLESPQRCGAKEPEYQSHLWRFCSITIWAKDKDHLRQGFLRSCTMFMNLLLGTTLAVISVPKTYSLPICTWLSKDIVCSLAIPFFCSLYTPLLPHSHTDFQLSTLFMCCYEKRSPPSAMKFAFSHRFLSLCCWYAISYVFLSKPPSS